MIGELRGMAAAVAGLQQAAVPATPLARTQCKQSPGPMSNQLEPVTPRGTSKSCGAKSGASYCKVPTNRGQRGRVGRWRRGCGTAAANAAAAAAGVAWENTRLSVQWMKVRGVSTSREVILPSFFVPVEPGVVEATDFASGLAGCAELSVPLKEVTRNLLKETVRNPVDLGIPSELWKICGLHGWWCGISCW